MTGGVTGKRGANLASHPRWPLWRVRQLLYTWRGTGGLPMILSHLAAVTLVVTAATGPVVEPSVSHLSLQQRGAATRVFMRSATECIVRSVAADSRFRKEEPAGNLGDLIVDAMPQCLSAVRAMIDALDRYFDVDSGEAFFMCAYLDALPDAVIRAIEKRGEAAGPVQLLEAK